jgi:hypothetical protein
MKEHINEARVACRNSFGLMLKVKTGLLVPKLPKCQNAITAKTAKTCQIAVTCRIAVTCCNC